MKLTDDQRRLVVYALRALASNVDVDDLEALRVLNDEEDVLDQQDALEEELDELADMINGDNSSD